MYKLDLPPYCPIGGSGEQTIVLFRIVSGEILTDDDLKSYVELYNGRYKSQCKAHGISFFSNFASAERVYHESVTRNRPIHGGYVAKIEILPQHGMLHTYDKNHYTLWLYEGVAAHNLRCVDVQKIAGI
jgi:hypothetical protein